METFIAGLTLALVPIGVIDILDAPLITPPLIESPLAVIQQLASLLGVFVFALRIYQKPFGLPFYIVEHLPLLFRQALSPWPR